MHSKRIVVQLLLFDSNSNWLIHSLTFVMMCRSLNFFAQTDPPRYIRPSIVIFILVPKNTYSTFSEAQDLTTNQVFFGS